MQDLQPEKATDTASWTTYPVWDVPTRVLHWLNATLVLAVLALGMLLKFKDYLLIKGLAAKVAVATVHSWIGCVLIGTFTARIVWGFRGNRFARLSSVLPNRHTISAARTEAHQLLSPNGGTRRLGHGPLGRLSSTAFFVTLIMLLSSGLFRANTDLYFPPLGHVMAAYQAKPGVDPSTLSPADMESHDREKLQNVYRYSVPMGLVHRVAAWLMVALIVIHVAGVMFKELRQGGAVLSSMVVGHKVFRVDDQVIVDDN